MAPHYHMEQKKIAKSYGLVPYRKIATSGKNINLRHGHRETANLSKSGEPVLNREADIRRAIEKIK
jgi:hypothetical protein